MYKFLIGPTLMGVGYVAGSVYGADSEQLVHKSREVTYGAVEQALDNIRPSGTTSFAGGTPVPYDIKIDRVADEQLVIKVFFSGRVGAQAVLDFVPKNDGHDTLVITRIHSEQSVLRTVLAGTDKAKLAYAPDWMLNLTVRPLLQQLASQIDQGGSADLGWGGPDPEAQWEANLTSDEREQVSQAQQYDATRPAVDPDADASQHMNDGGGGQ